jgi:hypothetical protein
MLLWGAGKFLLPAAVLLLLRTLRKRRRRVLVKGKFSSSPKGIADLKEAYLCLGGVLLALGRTPPKLFRRTPLPALHRERANSATRRAWKELALPGRPPILRRSFLLGLLHGTLPSVRGRWRFTSRQAIDAREDIAAALRGAGHPVERDGADELLSMRADDKKEQRRRMWSTLCLACSVGLILALTTMTLRILV